MAHDFLDAALARLAAAGLFPGGQPSGCTPEERAEIEARCGMALPVSYRRFLSAMGRSAGDFLAGTDFTYPLVLDLRRQADRLLVEGSARIALNPADFVFALHQGYQFLFFRCGLSDDPPVFYYEEGAPGFVQVAGSFSAWLTGCVDDEVAAAEDLRRT
jgi:hypothetical protein